MNDRGHLTTELSNPHSMHVGRLSTRDAFDLFNREDASIADAVAAARDEICEAIDLVADALRQGGRLIYIGAGTSGRLGVLDATECPPTFLTDPSMVQGVIAGGLDALTRSVEGVEDHQEAGAAAIKELEVGSLDVVFGIATGGTTPFVHGAIAEARQAGAKTVFLSCVPKEQVADKADVSIRVITGPELLTGSTRMKAGTATKMVLNMVSSVAMIRLGKVFGNLMVDVNTSGNAKLLDRGRRIIRDVTGCSADEAAALLTEAGGQVKTALVMHGRNVSCAEAQRLLREADGHVDCLVDS